MYECFVACIFFGTQFGGSEAARVASFYASTASIFGKEWYKSLLNFMTPSSQGLALLRHDLRRLECLLHPKINFYCTFEKEKIDFTKFARIPWLSSVVKKIDNLVVPKVSRLLPNILPC
ncbi:hypothetical protein K431DRAFT_284992 [Polychaeton citri CBS 116435]|uniref:Uncharacterized protein n=1 Tax=Polychaeton citri CBS 116435 TaxID=1314669 RepID=A0A9P4UQD4_9PEZI|nr:hypothetical protein K431DRAFT_284992 [Polychaeton citri CBS 116435]